jgi:hypothetical protein
MNSKNRLIVKLLGRLGARYLKRMMETALNSKNMLEFYLAKLSSHISENPI